MPFYFATPSLKAKFRPPRTSHCTSQPHTHKHHLVLRIFPTIDASNLLLLLILSFSCIFPSILATVVYSDSNGKTFDVADCDPLKGTPSGTSEQVDCQYNNPVLKIGSISSTERYTISAILGGRQSSCAGTTSWFVRRSGRSRRTTMPSMMHILGHASQRSSTWRQ